MRVLKISFALLCVATLLKIFVLTRKVVGNQVDISTALVALLSAVFTVALIFWLVTRKFNRYRSIARRMDNDTPAWICALELEQSYKILSVDDSYIYLWKLAKSEPVILKKWLRNNVQINKSLVNITAIRSFDGIEILANNLDSTKIVLYSLEAGVLSKPIRGADLDLGIKTIHNYTTTNRDSSDSV